MLYTPIVSLAGVCFINVSTCCCLLFLILCDRSQHPFSATETGEEYFWMLKLGTHPYLKFF